MGLGLGLAKAEPGRAASAGKAGQAHSLRQGRDPGAQRDGPDAPFEQLIVFRLTSVAQERFGF